MQDMHLNEDLHDPCTLFHVNRELMQGNLAKQLAKLVKVKYVEDISLASRVGMSPCTWVSKLITSMSELRTWISECCTRARNVYMGARLLQQHRTCFLQQ